MHAFKKISLFAVSTLALFTACNTETDKSAHKKQPAQQEIHHTPPTDKAEPSPAENAEITKVSEALGHFIGRNLKAPGIKFDLESIIKGMREGAAGKPAPMSDEEYEKAMTQMQEKAINSLAEKNMESANAFMKENAKVAGVVEIVPDQLQYTILQEGNGPSVPEHGTPLINYTGKYLDGTVFGSSESAGGPITVPIDQTIPGFTKGIAGMKEGEKRRLFIHPDLGYGRSGQLAPNALLIFDIEVVKATTPEKEKENAPHAAPTTNSTSSEEQNLDDDPESENDLANDEEM